MPPWDPNNLPNHSITRLLTEAAGGDVPARNELWSLVYAELHGIARSRLAGERSDHTMQATDLINELYLRLANLDEVTWENRRHFFGAAAEAMRRILVDHARSRLTAKRGGDHRRVELNIDDIADDHETDTLALDSALAELKLVSPRRAEVVSLLLFAGRSIDDTATLLGVSPSTVDKDWRFARSWLHREIAEQSRPTDGSQGS